MRTFILLAVVVAVASAATRPRDGTDGSRPAAGHGDTGSNQHRDNSGYDSGNSGYGTGNDGYGSRNGGYGSGNGGYGDNSYNRGGYGNNHARYGGGYYAPPPPPPQKTDSLDKLDKLFSRVDAVSDQLKTVSEQVVALEARQAVQVRFFDRLVTVTLEALANTDENQKDRLTQLEDFLTVLEYELENELEPAVDNLRDMNMVNREERGALEELLNDETDLDIGQAGRIARLVSITADFKDRLFQIVKNAFELFDDEAEGTTQDLDALATVATAKTCEVGEITLDDDECTAELTFQTDFGNQAPQIFLGLSGVNFNTNAVEDKKEQGGYGYSGGYGHNQGYHETEPGSIGTRLNAYTTPKGARFEFFFFGFGETKIAAATITYQACSIGPGIGRVNH
ncbi:hypothetical protein V1264_015533 [Littorina saxatilis]|uniref:Uncharacterized protein n=1 Tax=Littorina saxatilis TaxID=31220 RepID=A0AAN9GH33_9CAEN